MKHVRLDGGYLRGIHINWSSPLDVLPISLLKLCLPEIVAMITNIANTSSDSGVGQLGIAMETERITPKDTGCENTLLIMLPPPGDDAV